MKSRNKSEIDPGIFETARSSPGRATNLPPDAYRTPEFFSLEIDRIFTREWICVGHVGDVPEKGDYRCVDLAGEPLVMVRDMQDAVHVLSRICRHKWMEVVDGTGNTGIFTCPYHKWSYNLDGTLLGAPHMDQCEIFNKEEIRLPTLQVEIWEGFVWANFDTDCESLNQKLASLSERTQHYNMSKLKLVHRNDTKHACNWKIMLENFNDFYHHMGLHSNTLQPYYPAELATYEPFDGVATIFHTLPANEPDLTLSGDWPPITSLNEQERKEILNVGVYPNLSITYGPELVNALLLYPLDHQSVGLSEYLLVPEETTRRADFAEGVEKFNAGNKAIMDEDFAGCAKVQSGVNSVFAGTGPLSHLEESTRHGNQWIVDRLFPG